MSRLPCMLQFELLDTVTVTLADIELWMACVPGLLPDSPRYAHYVAAYSVVQKIAAAKTAGLWPACLGELGALLP